LLITRAACSLEALDRINRKLLAANPKVIEDGSAGISALRHIPASASWAIRSEPVPCEEANSLGVPCTAPPAIVGSKKKSFWKKAGGIFLILFLVALAMAALGLLACISYKKYWQSVHAYPSADVSKSPTTTQMHDKVAEDSALWRADPQDRTMSITGGSGLNIEATVCSPWLTFVLQSMLSFLLHRQLSLHKLAASRGSTALVGYPNEGLGEQGMQQALRICLY
jgi:hypothetical protein